MLYVYVIFLYTIGIHHFYHSPFGYGTLIWYFDFDTKTLIRIF